MSYPPAYHPGPQPKKRRKLPWLIGGAVLLMLCCGGVGIAALSSDDSPTEPATATGTDQKAKAKNAVPGLNQAARDGKFEFKVSGLKCGATQLGSDTFGAEAQGVFCLVDVSVRNIGNKAQLFDGSSQKVFDGDGTEFSHDASAAMQANDGTDVFLEDINPGNKLAGTLVFDVPKGTKLTTIELHDSPFSGGVTVALK